MGLTGIEQYLKKINEKAATVKEEDIVTCSCDCEYFGNSYYTEKVAEYTDSVAKAAERFYYHKVLGSLFWGVHYKGKHIVNIKDEK